VSHNTQPPLPAPRGISAVRGHRKRCLTRH
jgi:hypothetical protein